MKRRVFVTGFAGLLAAPRAAEAQPAGKVPRIGFLSDSRQPWDEGFRQGLRELGYVAGHNITIEYRYGEGKFERLPGLAAELVRLNVDLVVAGGTQATSSAKQATGVIPIVMGVSADPVGNGFVASLARPGGNITGLTSLSPDLSGKRLALLKEIVPRLSRVSVLWNSGNPDNASQLREAEAAANALGVQLLPIGVRSSNEFDKALSVINNARADGLYTLGDSLFANNRKRIVDFAAKNQLASMFSTRQAVEAGGLVSYGTDFVDLFRRAAIYVDKILKGAKPADLPIEQPTKFELVINLKTAKSPRPHHPAVTVTSSRPGHRVITRRTFLAGSVTLLTAPLAGEAQQAGKVYRIAWLAPAANPDNLDAFRNGLRALGYVEGTNIVMDTRYAERSAAQLFDVALELVRRDLDVIVTDGSSAASAVKRTGSAIPVVFVSGDPVGMGLVPRLSRPGGTMTGFGIVSTELSVKRLQLVREAFPGRSRLGVCYEKRQLGHMIPPMEAAARSLSLQLKRLEVNGAADIDEAFAAAVRERVAVVILLASALFQAERHRLVELAAKHRLPTIYENRAFSEAGGLMSYGPDLRDVFRRAATHVDKILKGAKPSDLPVEEPTKCELVINLKTAKALGLTIPPALLLRADQVIE